MNTTMKFRYSVYGGLLVAVGIIIGMVCPPLFGQNDRFGEITCTGLKIMDENGKMRIELDSGGSVTVFDENEKVRARLLSTTHVIGYDENGSPNAQRSGALVVVGDEEKSAALNATEILIFGKNKSRLTSYDISGIEINDEDSNPLVQLSPIGLKMGGRVWGEKAVELGPLGIHILGTDEKEAILDPDGLIIYGEKTKSRTTITSKGINNFLSARGETAWP